MRTPAFASGSPAPAMHASPCTKSTFLAGGGMGSAGHFFGSGGFGMSGAGMSGASSGQSHTEMGMELIHALVAAPNFQQIYERINGTGERPSPYGDDPIVTGISGSTVLPAGTATVARSDAFSGGGVGGSILASGQQFLSPAMYGGDDPTSLQRSAPLRSRQTFSQQVSRRRPQVTPTMPYTPSAEELWRRGNKGGLRFSATEQAANSLILSCHARASEKTLAPRPAMPVMRAQTKRPEPAVQAEQLEMSGVSGGQGTPLVGIDDQQRAPTPP
eukprot:Hpha_TRINITY_DN15584_c1_g2::TRINITY_DN15584_c1_g2_i1::g.107423::m.107423